MPDGSVDRDPVFPDANSTQYYGAILPNPATAQTVPLLEWCALDPATPKEKDGFKQGSLGLEPVVCISLRAWNVKASSTFGGAP